jgi:hypothetical protein
MSEPLVPLIVIAITFISGTLYWFPVRRWLGRWGASPEDLSRLMAGDALIVNPTHSATHAVTVNAKPGDIWPWLVQLGYRRGGLYSYDWLDRLFGILDRPSATRILPEFQRLTPGDQISLGPKESLTVTTVDPCRAFVLYYNAHGFEWVWQFGLYSIENGNCTRLVSRGTERFANTLATWVFMRIMEPAAFIMTRRMLLGVKNRAEGRVLFSRRGADRTASREARAR